MSFGEKEYRMHSYGTCGQEFALCKEGCPLLSILKRQALCKKAIFCRTHLVERPLPWETTNLEWPAIPVWSFQPFTILNMSPKTTCLERPHFYANGKVFHDRFYCTLHRLIFNMTYVVTWMKQCCNSWYAITYTANEYLSRVVLDENVISDTFVVRRIGARMSRADSRVLEWYTGL